VVTVVDRRMLHMYPISYLARRQGISLATENEYNHVLFRDYSFERRDIGISGRIVTTWRHDSRDPDELTLLQACHEEVGSDAARPSSLSLISDS
jgi:hypothetical protein